jgi:hypothetical protein
MAGGLGILGTIAFKELDRFPKLKFFKLRLD